MSYQTQVLDFNLDPLDFGVMVAYEIDIINTYKGP
jgi:hypothetical protein